MNLSKLAARWVNYSLPTFRKATALISVKKLRKEAEELFDALEYCEEEEKIADEYADCLMCLFDSFTRCGFTIQDIERAVEKKINVNKDRRWRENADGTYSHII